MFSQLLKVQLLTPTKKEYTHIYTHFLWCLWWYLCGQSICKLKPMQAREYYRFLLLKKSCDACDVVISCMHVWAGRKRKFDIGSSLEDIVGGRGPTAPWPDSSRTEPQSTGAPLAPPATEEPKAESPRGSQTPSQSDARHRGQGRPVNNSLDILRWQPQGGRQGPRPRPQHPGSPQTPSERPSASGIQAPKDSTPTRAGGPLHPPKPQASWGRAPPQSRRRH